MTAWLAPGHVFDLERGRIGELFQYAAPPKPAARASPAEEKAARIARLKAKAIARKGKG